MGITLSRLRNREEYRAMAAIIDTAARVEVAELLARYCHSVDHGETDRWVALFTADGSFEVAGMMRLQGADQLRTMPGVVAKQGGGKWRHQITNIVVEPGVEAETARVLAYGLVTDWREGGKPVSFTDYELTLRRVDDSWRIQALLACLV